MKPADSDCQHEQYLIAYDQISRFQLGRLLQRFHVLDELRSAGLFDRKKLFDASEHIRALGSDIDKRLHTDERGKDRASLNPEALKVIQARLNELTSGVQPKRGKSEAKAIGGLQYRISRSRYYASNFQRRMSDMLFERVEG